jgi:S1-C subfamily serine protease
MGLKYVWTGAALAAAALVAGCGGGGGSSTLSQQQLITTVKPSVVELSGKREEQTVGGSGVVIDAKRGLVLTNEHVVAGISALKAKVGDNAATAGPARVLAQAPCDDLAVVQLTNVPPGLKQIKIGSSAKVKSGEQVTVLGYPASFSNPETQTVVSTNGTVSSTNVAAEPDPSLPKYPSTIQHQAPVNPGNSGGPLVNSKGELIGINTLGNTQQGGRTIQGQYYAIAMDRISTLLPNLEAGKNQAWIGWSIAPVDQVTLSTAFAQDPVFQSAKLGTTVQNILNRDNVKGIYVIGSTTGSPAKNAKLGFGDLVLSIENTPVKSVADVCDILQSHGPGDKLLVRGMYLNSAANVNQVLVRWRTQVTLK